MTVKQLDICSAPPAQSVVEDAEALGVDAVAIYAYNASVPGCVASRGAAQGIQAGGKLVVPIITPSAVPGPAATALGACLAWSVPCRVIMVDLEGPAAVDYPPVSWVYELGTLAHAAGKMILGYAANSPAAARAHYADCGIAYWLQGTLNGQETIPAGWDGNQYTNDLRGPVSGATYDCSVLSDELWAAMQPLSEEDPMPQEVVAANLKLTPAMVPAGLVGQVNTDLVNAWVEVFDYANQAPVSVGIALVGADGKDITSSQFGPAAVGGTAEWYVGSKVGIGSLRVVNCDKPCLITVKYGAI